MVKNKLKKIWSSGGASINGWLSIPSAFGAEVMACQGYNSLTIDIQHGVIDYAEAVRILQAVAAYPITPLVRVSWLEPALIMKALDCGASGIICPMINNRAQAEKFVSFCRYPPLGMRSFGPTRALYSYGSDYYKEANQEILCLAMIETVEAMENLESIVSTPGLDGVYIGPSDLSLGIGNGKLPPGFDREEQEMKVAIKSVLKAAKKANIVAGLHCGSSKYGAKAINWGFDMITVSSDARLLATAASNTIVELRELLPEVFKVKSLIEPDEAGY
mgnify:CR=1 FL=1